MQTWCHRMAHSISLEDQMCMQFRHVADATAALNLSGIVYMGNILRFSKPNNCDDHSGRLVRLTRSLP